MVGRIFGKFDWRLAGIWQASVVGWFETRGVWERKDRIGWIRLTVLEGQACGYISSRRRN